MGKIIKNNILYGGSTEEAIDINYDNSVSGLSASSVQDAIDELDGNIGSLSNDLTNATEYHVGDSYSNMSYDRPAYVGYITTSSKVIYITAILDKNMGSDITTITVNNLNGLFRGVAGYIDGITTSTELTSTYTVTALKSAPNMVRIAITKDTAMDNATNNTVVICMARMSLSFS